MTGINMILIYSQETDGDTLIFEGTMEEVQEKIKKEQLDDGDYCIVKGKVIKYFGY